MWNAIVSNIRNFMDNTIFITILAIGIFMIVIDYPYFKTVKYKNDAAITLFIGIFYIAASFVLLIISKI